MSLQQATILCIWLDNKDVKEIRVQIPPIIHFSNSKCHKGPLSLPVWPKENLKTENIFTIMPPWCQRELPIVLVVAPWHRRQEEIMREALIPGRVFLYSPLLGMFRRCSHPLQRDTCCKSFVRCPLRITFCLWEVSKPCSGDMWILVPRNKSFEYLEGRSFDFSIGHLGFYFRAFFIPIQGAQD